MKNYFSICFFIILNLLVISIKGQIIDTKKYNAISDTLIIINKDTIDSERVLFSRREVMEVDTIRVNQQELFVSSFTMSATTLGHSVELTTNKPYFSQEMHNKILNNQLNYKYIYIKNINLQNKDGLKVKPTLNIVKIIFSN